MSLEQAIAENTAVLRELIALLGARPIATPTVTAAEVRQYRDEHQTSMKDAKAAVQKEKAKADPKPDAAPSSEPTQTASDNSVSSSSESTQAEKQEGVEYKQIQQLVPKIAKTPEGTEKVVALFGRYGVKRGPELKPEQYDDFYADLLKVEAGELDPRTAEV